MSWTYRDCRTSVGSWSGWRSVLCDARCSLSNTSSMLFYKSTGLMLVKWECIVRWNDGVMSSGVIDVANEERVGTRLCSTRLHRMLACLGAHVIQFESNFCWLIRLRELFIKSEDLTLCTWGTCKVPCTDPLVHHHAMLSLPKSPSTYPLTAFGMSNLSSHLSW